jgi:CIC family chloride channel protein
MKILPELRRRWSAWAETSQTGYMLLLAVGVGMLAGFAATVYRLALLLSYRLFFRTARLDAEPQLLDTLVRAGLPIVGGLIVGLVAYRLMRIRGTHGVPSLMKAVITGRINLPPSMAAKSGLSVITMASGASAGPEGPIVEIGAVMGSTIGRWARVTRERMGTLVGCGAASGIAAIFNAPLGGVFFALELILREFTIPRFSPVVLAAVIASVTTQVLLPGQPAFRVPPGVVDAIVPSFWLLVAFALLGPLCAAFSALYITAIYRAQDIFQRSVRLPMWLKPCLGGLLVGTLALFLPGIQGEGYEFVNEQILMESLTDASLGVAAIFLLYAGAKVLATALTLGSGFVGGAFAPALFIGGALGAAFGICANRLFPGTIPPPTVFALVGMAGGVAGALNAPFSAVLIVYEITGGQYKILLPLLITVALTVSLTRKLRPGSVYTVSLLREGFDVEAATQQRDPFAGYSARDIMVTDLARLSPQATLQDLLDRMADTQAPAFCVEDAEGCFRGLISVGDLRSVLALGDEMGPLLLAEEMADPHPQSLMPGSPLSEAVTIFGRSEVEAIPVLDEHKRNHVVGIIYRHNLMNLYKTHRRGTDTS